MPPPTTIHHHPSPAKIYPPPFTATHYQPKYIHHYPPSSLDIQNIYSSKKVFYKKTIKIFYSEVHDEKYID